MRHDCEILIGMMEDDTVQEKDGSRRVWTILEIYMSK